MSKNKLDEVRVVEEPIVEAPAEEAETTAEPIAEKKTRKASKEAKVEEKPIENHLVVKTVTATMLNVRKEPDVTSPVKTVLEKGTKITVKAITNGWAELSTGGFVMTQYIE